MVFILTDDRTHPSADCAVVPGVASAPQESLRAPQVLSSLDVTELHAVLGDLVGILRQQAIRAQSEHAAIQALLARADRALTAAERT